MHVGDGGLNAKDVVLGMGPDGSGTEFDVEAELGGGGAPTGILDTVDDICVVPVVVETDSEEVDSNDVVVVDSAEDVVVEDSAEDVDDSVVRDDGVGEGGHAQGHKQDSVVVDGVGVAVDDSAVPDDPEGGGALGGEPKELVAGVVDVVASAELIEDTGAVVVEEDSHFEEGAWSTPWAT